ncbi:MAG: NAD-dependent epimerase/dehydratase family protein [Ilumatobacteraceae bacterium]
MNVLVTGASSLLGRHLVEQAIAAGHTVTVMQRTPAGIVTAAGTTPVEILGSVDDATRATAACAGQDVVVHLAARVGVVGSFGQFRSVNVDGTSTMLAAARTAGVRGFVHVSSPSVAHTGASLVGAGPTPADPDGARGHYSVTKAMAEVMALAASSDDMPVVAIRPHLVWGPGDTQLVGRIVQRARSGRLALVGPGTALVDTTYVDNAAAALTAAMERIVDPDAELGGRALVVSNGEPRTVHELVSRIVAAAGIELGRLPRVPTPVAIGLGAVAERLWSVTRRTTDPPMTVFLAEQLSTAHWFEQRSTRRALRWVPTIGLDEGFERLTAAFAADSAHSAD